MPRASLWSLLFLFLAVSPCWPGDPAGRFPKPSDLELFLFPPDETVNQSLQEPFAVEGAGRFIEVAIQAGPAYASQVAKTVPQPEYRASYSDLARYLDMFGPCAKKDRKDQQSWWSSYPEPPSEAYCSEVLKLVFATLLWNQVHYCQELSSGEAKSKVPFEATHEGPPWRLDEPPVKTYWLKSEVLYAAADAAIGFRFAGNLRQHAQSATAPEQAKLKEACLYAAGIVEDPHPSRERVALALAKVLLRAYEAAHLRHLANPKHKPE